ncbi:MAG TPA: DUF971 domain-containing protein [Chloroflexota bacterium]|nr:DUF971 domain-containing protein [Chloroflexota bacterium]
MVRRVAPVGDPSGPIRRLSEQNIELNTEFESESLPTGVEVLSRARTLTVTWAGSPPTVIPWRLLRLACPCAACRGEMGTEQLEAEAIVRDPDETTLVNVVMMGNYALQPVWASGHSTGIYTWDYLRRLAADSPPLSR